MGLAETPQRGGRETRLLLVTIAVSVGVLLLLARFRFPEQASHTAEPAPAPLERLAARAVYDELASTMVDLERRIVPRVTVLAVRPERPEGRFVVAPRVTPDRAVTVLGTGETLSALGEGSASVLARDFTRELVVLSVRPSDDLALPRTGTFRPGPRYVVVVEGSPQGAILRPVYVGRTTPVDEPRTGTPHLQLSALQHAIPSGAAIFSLDGAFVGVVREGGSTVTVVPGEFLRTFAEAAQATPPRGVGSLGLEVQPLTPPLARAAGADFGVMVSHITSAGAEGEIQPGDVIQAVDGADVRSVPGYRQLEQSRVPGEPVVLTIVRAGSPQQVTITSADAAAPPDVTTEEHGIVGRAVPNAGIEVVAVQAGSEGARAGIQRGDLIVSVGGERPANVAQLTRTFRGAKPGDVLLVVVQRDERRQVLPLEKR